LEDRLKTARKYAGFTQPQLADAVGVSRRTIINYERDASRAQIWVVQNIALKCGVDEVWLLTGKGQMVSSAQATPSDQDIIKEHQDLIKKFNDPDQGLRIIKRIIILQEINPKLLDQVERYLTTTYETARTMMGNQDWDELELSLQQKLEPVAEVEKQKEDTGSD